MPTCEWVVQEVRGVVNIDRLTCEHRSHKGGATGSAGGRTSLQFALVLSDHDLGEAVDVPDPCRDRELKFAGLDH